MSKDKKTLTEITVAKAEALKAGKFQGWKFTKIEGDLQICDADAYPTIQKMAGKALLEGKMVQWDWPNGPTEWIVDEVEFDSSQDGSAAYTWDKAGNRVRFRRYRFTKIDDNEATKIFVKTVFKKF